ncbi:hypothetical protein [Sunxiuqinia indica]|uniref:hypothetical protein n=1 Tax=Sunxiuqinia indica TaxID=2692584 RepID=UPI0013582E50|nr:hypothetical protein [Sunxiuqinia indica]
MSSKVELFGVKELNDFFGKMKRAEQRRLILASFRIGAKPLITTARQLLRSRMQTRSTTRNLEKSIGFVAGRSRGKSVFITAKVGARKFGNYRGFHGHLYDAGTTERQTTAGHSRGRMPASKFFTDAINQTEQQLVGQSQDHMLKALDKLIQRNLKKINK